MIEVAKLIPQVYNRSRDFSVFTGLMQILFNEADQKSRILESTPAENLLLGGLRTHPEIKEYFRTLLKNKGSDQCILYAISLAGGGIFSFDEEKDFLSEMGIAEDGYLDRANLPENIWENRGKLVYYEEFCDSGIHKMHVNLKDPGDINQDLLDELFYYLKPVNTLVILEQAGVD